MKQSNRKTKGLKNTTLFCDNCGDITVAVRPVKIILLITIIALNVADIATTFCGLSLGATELSPLFSVEAIPVKIVLTFLYAGLFVLAYNLSMKEGSSKGLHVLNITLFGLVGVYAVVVANNLVGIILWGM